MILASRAGPGSRIPGAAVISLPLKRLLGAAAVLLIALPSRSRNFFIAGLVPLLPTFALIAHYIVGTERMAADLRVTALFGLWSLVPYAIYLLAVYWLGARLPLATTLLLSAAGWVVGAGILPAACPHRPARSAFGLKRSGRGG